MKKLCIITTIPAPIINFWGKQLEFLQSNGFSITVITAPDDEFARWLPSGVEYIPVKMSRVLKPWEDICSLFNIIHVLRKNRYDIVQYATPKAALFGAIASWFARTPVRLYLMWGLYYVTQTGFKRRLFKLFEKIACTLSTDIAPDSKGNVQVAVKEGLCSAEKIAVVGHGSANGVDTSRFDPRRHANKRISIRSELGIPENAKVFGTIAFLVKDKGINELIDAFVQVSQRHDDVYLVLVGREFERDPIRPDVSETIRSHHKIKRIDFTPEPESFLAAMDIFVLPTYREGFGVVNVEASAMELPVISTDVPGPQESIVNGETGLLVPAREVRPLVEAMEKLLAEPDYARQLGMAGRRRVQEFYEQKKLWQAILAHRNALLKKAGLERSPSGAC